MDKGPQHQLRAQFTGSVRWLCCWCGRVSSSRLDRTSPRVRCKNRTCQRAFLVGLVFQSLAGVQHAGVRAMPPCDVTFPAVPLETYPRWGAPVHRLVVEEAAETEAGTMREAAWQE